MLTVTGNEKDAPSSLAWSSSELWVWLLCSPMSKVWSLSWMASWNHAPWGLTRRLGGLFSDSAHDLAPTWRRMQQGLRTCLYLRIKHPTGCKLSIQARQPCCAPVWRVQGANGTPAPEVHCYIMAWSLASGLKASAVAAPAKSSGFWLAARLRLKNFVLPLNARLGRTYLWTEGRGIREEPAELMSHKLRHP